MSNHRYLKRESDDSVEVWRLKTKTFDTLVDNYLKDKFGFKNLEFKKDELECVEMFDALPLSEDAQTSIGFASIVNEDEMGMQKIPVFTKFVSDGISIQAKINPELIDFFKVYGPEDLITE